MNIYSNSLYLFIVCLLVFVGCSKENKEVSNQPGKEPSQSTNEGNTEHANLAEQNGETEEREVIQSKPNRPPVIRSITIVNQLENDPRRGFKAIVSAFDPDDDEVALKYQWKLEGEEILGETDEEIDWLEDFKKGSSVSVEVVPSDDTDEGVWKAAGNFVIPNSPPQILSEPKSRVEDGKFLYEIRAVDPDGDSIEYTLKNAPRGMVIEPATGIISWEFDEKDIGEQSIQIVVSDSDGAKASQILTFNIASLDQIQPRF